MREVLPDNILELADKNRQLMDKIGFLKGDDPEGLCTPELFAETGFFTEEMIRRMFYGDPADSSNKTREAPTDISLILVRPDMLHARNEFSHFIRSRFQMLLEQEVVMDRETYWQLYQYDKYTKESMHCRLTRAAISIGSSCCLMVFREQGESSKNFADEFFKTHKGKPGIYTPDTLRGDIVYRNAIKLGLHKLHIKRDETLTYATDPFGAYRDAAVNSDGEQRNLRYPLLFFTGVGVHVPDGSEIVSDLSSLLDLAQKPD